MIRPIDTKLLFSHASLAELLNKSGRGKLSIAGASVTLLLQDIVEFGMQFEPIREQDIITAAGLPQYHSDPFDRFLIAQAQRMQVPVVTADNTFQRYDVHTIW